MFDIFNMAMLHLLTVIQSVVGSYALAIIALTVLIRLVLWPLNNAQNKNMKQMQALQPKLKALQERHKDNPQQMQQELMKFYAEHKFNPMAGCLPMLVQIPIFIGLYGALSSPEFLARTGHEGFLFVDRLYNTLHGHSGQPNNGEYSVTTDDKFQAELKSTITLKNGNTLVRNLTDRDGVPFSKPRPLIPGEPVTLFFDFSKLGLSSDYADRVQSVKLAVVNQPTREVEELSFTPQDKESGSGTWLVTNVPTMVGENKLHYDVLALIILYGILTVGYQRLMQRNNPASDPKQAQLMSFMSLAFVGMLFFIPLPAGVLLYLVVTMLMMVLQLAWGMWRDGGKTPPPATEVVDVSAKK